MIAPSNHSPAVPPAFEVARDLAAAVWTRRVAAAAFFCGSITAVLLGIMACPRSYESEAKLFVRVGRESVTLDPTATTGQTISVYESRENELNSVLDTLQSRVVLSAVVDRLGADVILDGELALPTDAKAQAKASAAATPLRPAGGLLTSIGLSDPTSRRETAVAALGRSIGISAGKKSNVISVTCRASSPELAQRIASEVVSAFQAKHMEINRTAGSYEFFVEQTEVLKRQYETAAEELKEARNELGIASVEGRRTVVQNQIATLEADLLDARKSLAGTEASIDSTWRSMDRLPETVLAQQVAGSPNSSSDQVRKQLADLRLQEQTYLMRYTPRHPLVVSARERVGRAEHLLEAMGPQDLQETSALNPARQQLELRLLSDEAQADALRARAATAERQLADARKGLESLNSHEGRLTVLEHRRDAVAASHKTYAEKLEQARLDRELGREHITNVNVLQPATYVARPVRPNKRLIFAIGLVFAATGAVGLAIGLEYRPLARAVLRSGLDLPVAPREPHRPAFQEV